MGTKFMVVMAILALLMSLTAAAEVQSAQSILDSYIDQDWTSQTVIDSDDAADNVFNAYVRACKKSSATSLLPVGEKLLINYLFLETLCEPGLVLKVEGIMAALQDPAIGKKSDKLLQFAKLQSFLLMDGYEEIWWAEESRLLNEQEENWWAQKSSLLNEQKENWSAEEYRWLNGQRKLLENKIVPKHPEPDKGHDPEHH